MRSYLTMPSLIIDTSSEYCLLAIARAGRLLSSTIFLHENRLSHSLVAQISTLAQEANISFKELENIAVGVGPGSYTGTRVGVAVAKGLGFGLGIGVRGYCSLIAFTSCEGAFLSILPAKSGLIYCLKGRQTLGTFSINASELVTIERLFKMSKEVEYIVAKRKTDIPSEVSHLPFIPFHPHFDAILQHLEKPSSFAFEEKAELIYLHPT